MHSKPSAFNLALANTYIIKLDKVYPPNYDRRHQKILTFIQCNGITWLFDAEMHIQPNEVNRRRLKSAH